MDWYSIKYQEIYDEILDHIITAIEAKRTIGDNRAINFVFQDVVDSNLNGYLGIEAIASTHKKAFQQKINHALRTNYSYYTSWKTSTGMAALIIIAGFYMPPGNIVLTMVISLFISALIPFAYAIISSRKIKTVKGKDSIIKGSVLMHSNVLIFTLYPITQLIKWGRESTSVFLKAVLHSPAIYLILFYLFAIYGLSIIRLCKQEFKNAG